MALEWDTLLLIAPGLGPEEHDEDSRITVSTIKVCITASYTS